MSSIVNIGMPSRDIIKSEKKYIISNLIPVSIQRVEQNIYSQLFLVYQSSTESYYFVQILCNASDEISRQFIEHHPLYIENMKKNPKAIETYNLMISRMSYHNTFNGSFDFSFDDESGYYTFIGVRAITNKTAEIAEFYLNIANYIRLKVFMKNFLLCIDSEYIFADSKYSDFEIIPINGIKHDASSRLLKSNLMNPVLSTTTSESFIFDHYTMRSDRKRYFMNFVHMEDEDKRKYSLTDELDYDMFKLIYEKDIIIEDYFVEDEKQDLLILYPMMSSITNTFKKMLVLRVSDALISHTNILDPERNLYNIPINEKENKNE